MDDRETLRERLRAMLKRPPLHSKLEGVMAVREFKKRHAEARKLVDKPSATAQQLVSATETIRHYVEAAA